MERLLSKLSSISSWSPIGSRAGTPRPSSPAPNYAHSSGADAGVGSSRSGPIAEPPPSNTINVILFGEAGVGKSAVVNLIAQKDVAPVSADVRGCTMDSKPYHIPFDGINFCIFDTIGLNQPDLISDGPDSLGSSHLQAIERVYKLILRLREAGGVHLLLFCIRSGKITTTTQKNYRLFVEFLCQSKVPVGVVVTNCENEEKEMEDWWTRNGTDIESLYGIRSDGHACVAAVTDGSRSEEEKYKESQQKIRDLIKSSHSLTENDKFAVDEMAWLIAAAEETKDLVKRGGKAPKEKDMKRLLKGLADLGLPQESAKKIVDMMK